MDRLLLQQLLESVLGSRNVYFQPPSTLQMAYPCIVYERDYARTLHANNDPYRFTKRYQVTLIDRDPDSPVLDRLAQLQLCSFNRHFISANLNHDVFHLYF